MIRKSYSEDVSNFMVAEKNLHNETITITCMHQHYPCRLFQLNTHVNTHDKQKRVQGKTKRRKKNKHAKAEGAPKKPATSFVMFSNAEREAVKLETPGLNFLDVGKKLGEMWRAMEPEVKKEWEQRALIAKNLYLEEKKSWLELRALQPGLFPGIE